MARTPIGERTMLHLACRVDPLLIEQLDQLAAEDGRRRSDLMREALADLVERRSAAA